MSINHAMGYGQQGYTETYRAVDVEVNLLKKVQLEIAINDDFLDTTVDAIVTGAHTDSIGDGKYLFCLWRRPYAAEIGVQKP